MSLPLVLLLSADGHWHSTVGEALAGTARVECVVTVAEVEVRRAEEPGAATPVLIDTALMPDPDELKDLVGDWSTKGLVIVAYYAPSWRDAVDLLQAGAFDYVRKTDSVAQARLELGKLAKVLGGNTEEV